MKINCEPQVKFVMPDGKPVDEWIEQEKTKPDRPATSAPDIESVIRAHMVTGGQTRSATWKELLRFNKTLKQPYEIPELARIVDDVERRVTEEQRKADEVQRAAAKVEAAKTAGIPRDLVTDEHLARQFALKYKDDLRYHAAENKWRHWDEKQHRWETEESFSLVTLVREFFRHVLAQLDSSAGNFLHIKEELESTGKIMAVAALLPSERKLREREPKWDSDPFLLGTPSGVVDLRTGEFRPARRNDYITKSVAVDPADHFYPAEDSEWSADHCPMFIEFLEQIMGADDELVCYIWRRSGYYLTGSTREQTLDVDYGTGRNGKGVLTEEVIGPLMGDYAVKINPQMLMVKKYEGHPTEIARLRGVRLAYSAEPKEGGEWDVSKLKQHTGDKRLSGHLMRQDEMDFQITHKLHVLANNKPSLEKVEVAERRRFHIVPFNVTFPEGKADLELGEKLRTEWPAILRWQIAGAVAWYKSGLRPPKKVIDMTSQYLDSEDSLGQWIREEIDLSQQSFVPSKHLFTNYRAWCEDEQDKRNVWYQMRQRDFTLALVGRLQGIAPWVRTGELKDKAKTPVVEGVALRFHLRDHLDDEDSADGEWTDEEESAFFRSSTPPNSS